jgi:hypothetical protein
MAGWGPHGPPSSWKNDLRPATPTPRRKGAQELFAEWDQEREDFGLRVYTDYKLDLTPLLRRTDADHLRLQDILSGEELRGFRMIQHLTLAQVRRVHYLVTAGH